MDAVFMDKRLDAPGSLYADWLRRLSKGWQGAGDGGETSAEDALRALWRSIRPESTEDLPPLDGAQIERLEDLVRALEKGEPLAHLTGHAMFMGVDLLSGPEALIPQQETELLGSCARDILRKLIRDRGSATVLDICTGAGNLAVALAHEELSCRVFATDVSESAVRLARRNAERATVSDRVEVLAGDLFAPLAQRPAAARADLIVCNPPYISSGKVDGMPRTVARCGPRLAFDGGPFGLNILNRIVQESPDHLKPESFVCFEVGAGQGPFLSKLMKNMPVYADVQTASDAQGTVRVLIGRTRGDVPGA
jgi:release factor glutamine methyltransferase